MNNQLLALLAAPLLAFSGAGAAEHADSTGEAPSATSRYIGVLGTYMEPDKKWAPFADYGNGVGFIYGMQWANGLGLEANLFADLIETGRNQGTDYYRQSVGLDLFYAFGSRDVLTPFVLVGAAYARNDVYPDNRDDYDWMANAGIGLVTTPLLFDLFRLRGELRYLYDDFEDGYTDYRAGVGIEFPIYRKVIVLEGEERLEVVEVSTGLNDSDGDGIVDARDKCPDTPGGDRVDGEGCTLQKVTALRGVTFEFDKSRLRPDARKILDDVVEILKRYPDMKIEIAGHTDWKGKGPYNMTLSQERADSVKNYLVENGVPESQVRAKGYGEHEPVATNDTEEGRELNRRVEMRILN